MQFMWSTKYLKTITNQSTHLLKFQIVYYSQLVILFSNTRKVYFIGHQMTIHLTITSVCSSKFIRGFNLGQSQALVKIARHLRYINWLNDSSQWLTWLNKCKGFVFFCYIMGKVSRVWDSMDPLWKYGKWFETRPHIVCMLSMKLSGWEELWNGLLWVTDGWHFDNLWRSGNQSQSELCIIS